MVRAADSWGAVAVTGEAITADANGLIKLAEFPIVRPFQAYDLRGNTLAAPENPVVLTVDGSTIDEYRYRDDYPVGTYFKIIDNTLGYLQLVDKDGAAVGSKTGTINYWRATNCLKFDLQHAAEITEADHLDGALIAVGKARGVLKAERFARPNFALLSAELSSLLEGAQQFSEAGRRMGNTVDENGDLATIRGMPVSQAEGVNDLGASRLLIGETGQTQYTIARPFEIGKPFDITDTKNKPVGIKIAYGEEYSSMQTPLAVRGRYMSVVLYDSAVR